MTKAKRTVSKTRQSTSEDLRQVLCYGRGVRGEEEDVAIELQNALQAMVEVNIIF